MSTEDRRAPGAARVSFEGLVEVGGTLGPSFEAQAVNVSEEGMQLRTAYLPELGQQITCRFEPAPNESVIGSGEVVWSRGAEKGGEFGIRFTDIDADSVEALKHVCGLGATAAPAQRGAKVRLYIEGLASPMRAKIRDADPTAMTVGSDLGFLQVGKQLELEDAQSGHKRPARIDHVEVAVDPTSQVPQLVVTLRYSDVPADLEVADVRTDAARDPGQPDDAAALDDASARMKGAFARQAARLGPAIQRWANHAKLTIALLAKRRRDDDDSVRRRTTAPAPSGGLHASGRRVVRGDASGPADGKAATPRRSQHPDDSESSQPKSKTVKRKAAAAAVMLVAVLGAVAIKKSHHDTTQEGTVAAPASADTATTPATPLASAIAPPAGPVATEVAPTLAAPLATGATTEKPGTGASTAAADDGVDPTNPAGHKRQARVAPFGNGPVHHGNVLRLRMDGPIEVIEGAQQPTGFDVKVPGRRSLEAAAPLAARDSRIAAIKVNNASSGAMLTVAFKDGVPNYQVSAKGDMLVIALAPAGPLETTVAKRDDKSAKSPKHGTRTRDDTPER
ncbi:MAG TPA: PilZ domain-containing protein [Polyangiaceae bacterium]|nr:PilZ domain-containing protein [Polyangiaceae bacterium]